MHGVRLPRMIANTTLTYLHVISRIGKLLRGIQRRIHGVQVGNLNDFDCYQRAELIPDEDISCGVATRQTQLANATHPAQRSPHISPLLWLQAQLCFKKMIPSAPPQCSFLTPADTCGSRSSSESPELLMVHKTPHPYSAVSL